MLAERLNDVADENYISFRVLGKQVERVHIDSVICFKAVDKYVDVFYYSRQSKMVRTAILTDTLKRLHACFPGFWRIHRNALVNPKYMSRLMKEEGTAFMVMLDGSKYPISRRYWSDVSTRFKGVMHRSYTSKV